MRMLILFSLGLLRAFALKITKETFRIYCVACGFLIPTAILKGRWGESSRRDSTETNLTSVHEYAGSIPGLA